MASYTGKPIIKTLHLFSQLTQMLYTIDANPPSSTLLRSRPANNSPERRQADVPTIITTINPKSPPSRRYSHDAIGHISASRPAIPTTACFSLKVGFGR
ncbi:hypothetical protein THARTR1_05650 [Trichoderma harzianum]|uniref:Uncharacterized protein n=1 Tax=Trichoderma harzianum TaxID=5544 RepID=A0A2K0U864_TRIHA|nr:hypothetical protein THARTR1_05650 [Trichoderma harzianum]